MDNLIKYMEYGLLTAIISAVLVGAMLLGIL